MKTGLMPRAELELDRFALDPYCKLYLPLWKLDGNSFMSKDAYGHLCTNYGSIWIPHGRSFDGVDDYVKIITNILKNQKVSVEAWVKTTNTGGTTITYENGNAYYGWRSEVTTEGYAAFVVVTSTGLTAASVVSLISVIDNNWHHIVATDYETTLRIYIDGNLNNSASSATKVWDTTMYVYMGARRPEAATALSWYDGLISEVRIYSRALTPQEILDHYIIGKEMFG